MIKEGKIMEMIRLEYNDSSNYGKCSAIEKIHLESLSQVFDKPYRRIRAATADARSFFIGHASQNA